MPNAFATLHGAGSTQNIRDAHGVGPRANNFLNIADGLKKDYYIALLFKMIITQYYFFAA